MLLIIKRNNLSNFHREIIFVHMRYHVNKQNVGTCECFFSFYECSVNLFATSAR